MITNRRITSGVLAVLIAAGSALSAFANGFRLVDQSGGEGLITRWPALGLAVVLGSGAMVLGTRWGARIYERRAPELLADLSRIR